MPNRFNFNSLRRRIYFTCCVLVGLCLVNTMIGWIGQSRLLEKFAAYEAAEETLAKVGDLEQNVQELKARSEKYLQTGATSQLTQAMDLQDRIANQISLIIDESTDQSVRQNLTKMGNKLDVFRDRLLRAAEERDLRTELIERALPRKHQRVVELFDRLQEQIDSNPATSTFAKYLKLVRSHDASLQSLQQYFIEPDSIAYERALSSIDNSRRITKAITDSLDGPESRELYRQLDKELLEFRRIGSRAFQATRGYMVYSNVVMAGEISEFVYDSNQLKLYVENQRVQNRSSRMNAAKHSRTLGFLSSLSAVALAILMATRLSYLIVSPISRLTETFRRLGQGESVDEIPERDRCDEIGNMARAAKIFSDKNRETHELLDRSERLSAELASKAEALEKSNLELDNFAYVASHDLKSPLRGINNLANWVQEDCSSLLPNESQDHLQQLKNRVCKMESLLDNLLEYSRVGRMNPQPEKIDVGELIASIVSLIDLPEGFKINLLTPTFSIEALRTPLAQALMNLMANGVKYNDKGAQGKLEISVHQQADSIQFSVRDNGIGIAPKYHSKVFEMYQRLDPKRADGSGMGLAIVKKLIDCHGGELFLESEVGAGSTFSFTWPCVDRSGQKHSAKLASESVPR